MFNRKKPNNTIKLGGETIEVRPLCLESCLRLALLLAPHIAKVETRWPEIKEALETTNGTRPQLLETVFTRLYEELSFAPSDVVTALALLLDRDIEFVARQATAMDLVKAWPTLDRVNNFKELWQACRSLGVTVKYAQ